METIMPLNDILQTKSVKKFMIKHFSLEFIFLFLLFLPFLLLPSLLPDCLFFFSFLSLSASSWLDIYKDLSKKQWAYQAEQDTFSLSFWKLWREELHSQSLSLSHMENNFQTSGQSSPWCLGRLLIEGEMFRMTTSEPIISVFIAMNPSQNCC